MNARLRLLRLSAILIAVAGAIDPAFSAMRAVKPEVALVADPRLPDSSLIERVAAALNSRFQVIRGPSLGASATVVVGNMLPAASAREVTAAFVITPEARAPFVTIPQIDAPERAHLLSRIPVHATVRVQAGRGRALTMTMRQGASVVDQATRNITQDDETVDVDLSLVATATGIAALTVTAEIAGSPDAHAVDASVNVRNERATVLFFDRRPSWMSTFVRRAIESDPRFIVTSRVLTSRGAAAVSGRAPDSLGSLPALEAFDLLIAGAPDALTAQDADGLEKFMREHGRSVVLLLDEATESPVLRRLTGVTSWIAKSSAKPEGLPSATETFAPASRPTWSEGAPGPIWSMAVGSGRLTVSGALDAWRYRSASASAFDAFWRTTVAEAASQTSGNETKTASESTRAAIPDERALLQAWAASHRGRVMPERDLSQLAPALTEVLRPPVERVTVRPMRSVWWLPLFAGCLGVEWWLRRRAGYR